MAVMPNAHPERWRTVHEFVELERPFREVRRFVAAQPQSIVAGSAQARVAGLELDRDIHMVVGDLQVGSHSARLPIHWEDRRHRSLFPLLDGTLQFTPVPGRRPITQIAFFGHYRPPLGPLGTLGDTLAGARLVVESVGAFLADLAARLEQAMPGQCRALEAQAHRARRTGHNRGGG
jgi:hypothetical protein